MTELLFLKFNLASPLATDANVRMSEPDESSRNYHVQVEIVSKHDSWPGRHQPSPDLWGLTPRSWSRAAPDSNKFCICFVQREIYILGPSNKTDGLLKPLLGVKLRFYFNFHICLLFSNHWLFLLWRSLYLIVRPFQSYLTRGDGWKSLFRFNEGKLLNSVKCGPKLGCLNMNWIELNCSI